MSTIKDPWDWTIDEVVHAFCSSRALWNEERPHSRLPEPIAFEHLLRDNMINGSTLLTDVDASVLKDDFAIRALGERSAIMYAIQKLRVHSPRYMTHSSSINPHQAQFAPSVPTGLRMPYAQLETLPSPMALTNAPPLLLLEAAQPDHADVAPSETVDIAPEADGTGSTARVRPGETLVDDNGGRKRRRLALMPALEPSLGQQSHTADSQPQDKPLSENSDILPAPGDTVKSAMTVDPNPLRTEFRKKNVKSKDLSKGFLGESKITADEVFYGTVKTSRPLPDTIDDGQAAFLIGHGDGEDEFHVNSTGHVSDGRRLYVGGLMRHFLTNREERHLQRNGKQLTAIYPYRERLVAEGRGRSVTLFQDLEGEVQATREDALMVVNGGPDVKEEVAHEWDYLAKWDNERSGVLPVFGESGSEGEYSSTCLEEIQAERDQQVSLKKNGPMTQEEVSKVIEEMIEEYVQRWKLKKLPLREHTARTMWRKAKNRHMRALLIGATRQDVQKLDLRLSKLKDNILQEVWKKPADVRRLCQVLEETVNQREENLWKISVWHQKNEPPSKAAPRRKKKVVVENGSGDEGDLLSSQSELASDDMTAFVEDDGLYDQPTPSRPRDNLSQPPNRPDQPSQRQSLISLHTPEESQEGPLSQVPDATGDHEADPDFMQQDEDPTPDGPTDTDAQGVDAGPIQSEEDVASPAPTSLPERKKTDETSVQEPVLPDQGRSYARYKAPESIIDLTYSDTDSPMITPVKSRFGLPGAGTSNSPATLPKSKQASRAPEEAGIDEVVSWSFSDLEERNDRKRLVMKVMLALGPTEYSALRKWIEPLQRRHFVDEVKRGVGALMHNQQRLPGVPEKEFDNIAKFSKLYICWTTCQQRYWSDKVPQEVFKTTLTASKSASDFDIFYPFVKAVFKTHQTPLLFARGSQQGFKDPFQGRELAIDQSSDSDETPAMDEFSPRKKRKREVKQSQEAIQKREMAQQRLQEQEARERVLKAQMGPLTEANSERIIVNPGKLEEHDLIYLNPLAGSRILKHQIEGIQFMWRELVVTNAEPQGCLLAHTMGLGKTMQVITLLVTIAEAAKSTEKGTSCQIPDNMKTSRTLIICPASLIRNWLDELYKWVPEPKEANIGSIGYVDAEMPQQTRLRTLSEWSEKGGVMVISYNMLRQLVQNKTSSAGRTALNEEQHEQVRKNLLEAPNIVVADEAHVLKNHESSISKVAAQFKTRSRIALTGSPLANHLQDYYVMMDWIYPGFLGSLLEFRAIFQEPIESGLYVDSTATERRHSMKKLRVLKSYIDLKVHRADITVLKGSLKPKVEFVIGVPLTEIQASAYRTYVRLLLSDSDEKIDQTTLWNWLAVLGLLCNHPQIFLNKITERERKAKKKVKEIAQRIQDDSSGPGGTLSMTAEEENAIPSVQPGDEHVSKMKISQNVIKEEQELLQKVDNLESEDNAYKVKLLVQIIDLAKEAGDQVLVFSQSLPTMDFLQSLFRKKDVKHVRLDGKTGMAGRSDIAKDFNAGMHEVFLISTRAGGLGINLPAANRVVIFDFAFNPTWEEQAIGRAYRIGQNKPVFVYRFMADGTFENNVFHKAVFKTQLSYRVVDKRNPRSHAEKSRDFLFEPRETEQQDIQLHNGKDPLVLDRILTRQLKLKSPHIRSIITTETLQADAGDDLTEAELLEVNQMIEDDKLRKENPDAFAAKQWKLLQSSLRPSGTPAAASSQAPQPFAPMGNTGRQIPRPKQSEARSATIDIVKPSDAFRDQTHEAGAIDVSRHASAPAAITEEGLTHDPATDGFLPVRAPSNSQRANPFMVTASPFSAHPENEFAVPTPRERNFAVPKTPPTSSRPIDSSAASPSAAHKPSSAENLHTGDRQRGLSLAQSAPGVRAPRDIRNGTDSAQSEARSGYASTLAETVSPTAAAETIQSSAPHQPARAMAPPGTPGKTSQPSSPRGASGLGKYVFNAIMRGGRGSQAS